MILTVKQDSPNVRRLSMLKLQANNFEEEQILFYLHEIISHGGEMLLEPTDDKSYPPKIGDFPGEP